MTIFTKRSMISRRNNCFLLEFLPILLLISTTTYQIIYFQVYEYGTPLHAQSVTEYKKKYNVSRRIPYKYPLQTLSSSDYNKLIDLEFTFGNLNLKCGELNPFLLIAVYTAPGNFDKRRIVRSTWGVKRGDFLLLFILGESGDEAVESRLLEENKIHGDFLVGSFRDSYKNLTYKHVMMLKYLIYHCPQAKYLLKADDDIYVNTPVLLNFLQELSPAGSKKFLFCPPNYAKVVRSFRQHSSKWRLTFKEYPHKNHPPSCNGFFFVYSKDVAFFLYREAQKSEYFWLEDVHVTGHLFKRMNVGHVDARPFMVHQKKVEGMMVEGMVQPWPFFFSGPDLSQREIEWLNDFVCNRSEVGSS